MAAESQSEQRTLPRIHTEFRAVCFVAGETFEARIQDLGAFGMGVITKKNLPECTSFKLRCFFNDESADFEVEVKHRGEDPDSSPPMLRLGVQITQFPENFHKIFESLCVEQGTPQALPPAVEPENSEAGSTAVPTAMHAKATKLSEEGVQVAFPPRQAHVKMGPAVHECWVSEFSSGEFHLAIPEDADPIEPFRIKFNDDEIGKILLEARAIGELFSQASPGQRLLQCVILKQNQGYSQFLGRQDLAHAVAEEAVPKGTQLLVNDSLSKPLPELLSKCRYQYEKELGKGGFASVFLVVDLGLNRQVAMKILHPQYANDSKLSQRFIAEAQIAAQFHHPNIALVYEVGVFEAGKFAEKLAFPPDILEKYPTRIAYFTMQYIEGRTLIKLKKNEKKLSQMQTLYLIKEAGKALGFAHEKGVVHRDIKPENIMVTYENQVLVTDFGIAKVLHDQQPNASLPQGQTILPGQTGVNQTAGFLGTPNYVSPEQAQGEGVDARADIYSLGITAYEMLTGRVPFQDKSWLNILRKHISEPPTPLREIDPDIHPNMAQFVHRCLEKNPEDRFQTVAEMLTQLEEVTRYLQYDPMKLQALEEVDDEARETVKKLFQLFAKSFRTIGTYPSTHDMVILASKALYQSFETYFERYERLDLEVDSMELVFQRISVFQEDQRETSLCFNLYRDGIRRLSFFRGFTQEEMNRLMVQLFNYIYDQKSFETDSVTLLFQLGLQYVDFEYVDAFYEDREDVNRLRAIETALRKPSEWNLETMHQNTFPIDGMVSFYSHLQQMAAKIDIKAYLAILNQNQDVPVRNEAVRIALSLMERETNLVALDHQYQLMEQVIFSSVFERDLKVPLTVLKILHQWGEETPGIDARNFKLRWQQLSTRLSEEDFLDQLIDMFVRLNRNFRDAILALCAFLDAEKALPILFEKFTAVTDDWLKMFLADMCVATAAKTPKLLIDMTANLNDNQSAQLIRAFVPHMAKLPKSAFAQWLSHPGGHTRLALVNALAQVNRPDTLQFLKSAALETDTRYYRAKQAAWKHLQKNHPDNFRSMLKRYYQMDALKNLSALERKLLFESIPKGPLDNALRTFLIQLISDSGVFGGNSAGMEDKKRAAAIIAASRDEEGLAAMHKITRKVFGNREFAQYCRQLLEAQPS